MSYMQLRDVLTTFRRAYSDFESCLSHQTFEDPDLAAFARKMLDAERHMRIAICTVESSVGKPKLNAWLQFFPDRNLRKLFEQDLSQLTSIDALLDFYWQFNETVVSLFELIGRSTESESIRNAFQNLASAEIQVGCELAWASRDMQATRPAA